MHPENKLTNHGKTGNGGAQSQHQNVNQGPTCNLGSKGVGAGNHGAKANQISPSNSSLKNPQAGVPPFSSLKGKVKRERSVSVDSGEQREAPSSLATRFSRLALANRSLAPPPGHFLATGLARRIGPQQKFAILSAPTEA